MLVPLAEAFLEGADDDDDDDNERFPPTLPTPRSSSSATSPPELVAALVVAAATLLFARSRWYSYWDFVMLAALHASLILILRLSRNLSTS